LHKNTGRCVTVSQKRATRKHCVFVVGKSTLGWSHALGDADKAALCKLALEDHGVEPGRKQALLCVRAVTQYNVVEGWTVGLGAQINVRECCESLGSKVPPDGHNLNRAETTQVCACVGGGGGGVVRRG
jgi:hypothetical protein